MVDVIECSETILTEAKMVEQSLGNREIPGSIPPMGETFLGHEINFEHFRFVFL